MTTSIPHDERSIIIAQLLQHYPRPLDRRLRVIEGVGHQDGGLHLPAGERMCIGVRRIFHRGGPVHAHGLQVPHLALATGMGGLDLAHRAFDHVLDDGGVGAVPVLTEDRSVGKLAPGGFVVLGLGQQASVVAGHCLLQH